jgi:hypothetical protein
MIDGLTPLLLEVLCVDLVPLQQNRLPSRSLFASARDTPKCRIATWTTRGSTTPEVRKMREKEKKKKK